MRAGGLKVKVEIWRNAQVGVTALNEPIVEEVLWKSTRAEMVARRGREHFQDGSVFSMTHFYFTFRYFSVVGIESSMWLKVKGQTYNVENIDPDFQNKDRIVVEARVANINAGLFALEINVNDVPDGVVGVAYDGFTLAGTGGTSPLVYSVLSGALPAGLSLNSATGAVTGTPTAAGTESMVFRVTDAEGKTADLPEVDIAIAAA